MHQVAQEVLEAFVGTVHEALAGGALVVGGGSVVVTCGGIPVSFREIP